MKCRHLIASIIHTHTQKREKFRELKGNGVFRGHYAHTLVFGGFFFFSVQQKACSGESSGHKYINKYIPKQEFIK